MGDLTKHFSRKEFACRHCGKEKIDLKLVHALETAREDPRVKMIVVTSGYRCPDHPESLKRSRAGQNPSCHTLGKAADVILYGQDNMPLPLDVQYEILQEIPAFRDGGIGVYHDWFRKGCHVDLGPCRRWTRRDGRYLTGIELV